jgi:hypothetical protein
METVMRLWRLGRLWRVGWVFVALGPAACGGGDKPAVTLSVTCGGSLALVGARSVEVLGDPVNGHPTLSFPDPVNPGQTNTLSVPTASRCSITPVAGP